MQGGARRLVNGRDSQPSTARIGEMRGRVSDREMFHSKIDGERTLCASKRPQDVEIRFAYNSGVSVGEAPCSTPSFTSRFSASCSLSSFCFDRLSPRILKSSCCATSWPSCDVRSGGQRSGRRPSLFSGCEPTVTARQLVGVSGDAGDAPAVAPAPGGEALDVCATAGSTAVR